MRDFKGEPVNISRAATGSGTRLAPASESRPGSSVPQPAVAASDARSPSEQERAYFTFLARYPEYPSTSILDKLRATEYARLDEQNQVYLDYTGGSLYAVSQLQQHYDLLRQNVFGNPHSINPTSLAMTHHVERARAYVLDFFNASPDEYFAIFTQNASGALKHVGESYPFGPGSRYLLTFDNHNSVNGIREFARAKGAAVSYLPVVRSELRVDRQSLPRELAQARPGANHLFAFPAQSNFSGVQHALEMIEEAHAAGWDVLLDAAAFVPSNRLDLSRWKPDFVSISFYKMFGYPTGVGCLLMRKPMFAKFRRPWFAGGTVQVASVQGDGYYLAKDQGAYEDGTLDYLSLPAIEVGLRYLAAIGTDVIHERVLCLTGWLLDRLSSLQHSNGLPLAQVHGPRNLEARGGTIAFNLLDRTGQCFDIRRVEQLANEAGISLRTGCFCNPGAGEVAYGLSSEQIGTFFHESDGLSFDELRARVRNAYHLEIGAIRISVGLATNFTDVFRFIEFARSFLEKTTTDIGTVAAGTAGHSCLRDAS